MARYRHQQPASEIANDTGETPDGDEAAEDGERPEKIEVHVHVHRDDAKKARAKRRPEKSPLTGVLFDWQGHYDQLFKKPPPWAGSVGPKVVSCAQCKAPVGRMARSCNRCGAQRSARMISRVAAMLGLGVVALVFSMCAHYLGHSTASYVAPKPLGEWSESDVIFVGVPAEQPSAFSYSDSTTSGSSTDRMATR